MQQILSLAHEQGVIRPRDLSALGINPAQLRRLVLDGAMVKAGRGLYMLSDYDVTEHHSLVEAIQAQSKGVICLLSALNFHSLGTQLPHQVWVSIPFGARISTKAMSMRIVVTRAPAYEAGIEIHQLEGVDVPVYSVAKTVADCFKFRNRIGLDVAIEALQEALRERRCSREEILAWKRLCALTRRFFPYE